MAYTILYYDEVLDDVQQDKVWYKEQKDGLEIEFGMSIEKAIEQIIKMPTAYSIRYKNVRIAHPKVFPYNIHFYIDDSIEAIVITAIVHIKRHPDVALSRTK
jgi:hypothetical protein